MEGLTKKIRGDWFDLREIADEPFELEEYFSFDKTRLTSVSEELRLAVERGAPEYKNRKLSELYAFLDSYQYDSRGYETLARLAASFSELLYVTLLQRLIATGVVKVRCPKGSESSESSPLPGLKDIVQDVQERIAKNPELRTNETVKNILMQVSIYRNELARMKELEPKILPDKKASFLKNFKDRFGEITSKIQEHYRVIAEQDQKQAASQIEETHPLKRYNLKPLGKLLSDQASEISQLRSTLQYANSERYKVRDILSGITDRRERTRMLIQMETSKYAEITGPGVSPAILGKAFAAEIIKVFARQISRL